MAIERYGVKIGRLWLRWPEFYWRDLWIGIYVKEPFWEVGIRRQVVYVCPIPSIVFLVEWSSR